jgi:hypothetical protein
LANFKEVADVRLRFHDLLQLRREAAAEHALVIKEFNTATFALSGP